jgi:hypothetical protein
MAPFYNRKELFIFSPAPPSPGNSKDPSKMALIREKRFYIIL